MSVIVNEGRAAIASAISAKTIHLAWGEGDPAWDTTPVPPSKTDNALVAEVGRRALKEWSFVIPDDNGDVQVPEGNFTKQAEPSQYILFSFAYDYADASDKVIREIAVFMDTQFVGGLPAGQKYFLPADITDAGLMLSLGRVNIPRSAASREAIDVVITF